MNNFKKEFNQIWNNSYDRLFKPVKQYWGGSGGRNDFLDTIWLLIDESSNGRMFEFKCIIGSCVESNWGHKYSPNDIIYLNKDNLDETMEEIK